MTYDTDSGETVGIPGAKPVTFVGRPMEFPDEQRAVDYTVKKLEPYCQSITREPSFRNGLRPDIGIRLRSLPDIPIAIEVKKWKSTRISPFPEAVAQAADYARLTGYAAFVGPFESKNMSGLHQAACRFESGLLVAGQLSVGVLYFTGDKLHYNAVGGLVLAGVQVAHFLTDEFGDPVTRLHDDAARLLTMKHRSGSRSWR